MGGSIGGKAVNGGAVWGGGGATVRCPPSKLNFRSGSFIANQYLP